MVAEKRGKVGERYSSELPGPLENGNHGRSHGALTGQRLLYSRIFLFHVKQLSPDTSTVRGRQPGLGANGHNAKSPIGKDVEVRGADE